MTFRDDNEKERLAFVDRWSAYVLSNDDKDWSRQQNVIINSCLRSGNMKKEEYFAMKGIKVPKQF